MYTASVHVHCFSFSMYTASASACTLLQHVHYLSMYYFRTLLQLELPSRASVRLFASRPRNGTIGTHLI